MQHASHQDAATQIIATSETRTDAPPIVVGVGGSAGALPALLTLLEALEGYAPLALVVVLHLSPDHESDAVEILQRVTPLAVTQVRTRTRLEPGHVYVIVPGMDLISDDGHVQPAAANPNRPSTVIDLFFRSLANAHRENAIGIVLSGTGRDGSLGLAQIKEFGGLTIAQAADDCEHDDMPRAALGTGAVDLVLSAAEIGKRLASLAKFHKPMDAMTVSSLASDPDENPGVDPDRSAEQALYDILTTLRIGTRHDFRNYKRATLWRRIERRIQVNRLPNIQAYRDFLQANPVELGPLLADMLISVTNFFRDPGAFDVLHREVITPLLENLPPEEEVRVWVPGCASGEESYSVAILFQEKADRMARPPPVQVFASDINDAALNVARGGTYPPNIEADVSESRLLGYFEQDEGMHYRVRSLVREKVLFARHNLLSDPPFSRLDLICCRNLLIYLDRAAQATVLQTFAYALKPGGYLFLGNAESVDAAGPVFEPVDKEHRIYRLRSNAAVVLYPRVAPKLSRFSNSAASIQAPSPQHDFRSPPEAPLARLHERAVLVAAPPSVLINAELDIERVSPGASKFVAFAEGVPTRNLLSNVPLDIRVELRAAIFRANTSGRPVHTVFRRSIDGSDALGALLALSVHPVIDDNQAMHWLVVFGAAAEDSVTRSDGVANDTGVHEPSHQQLEDENRSLKAHLQDTLDRSVISNEELKASNEELQAINEELRSAKEELETSKEELQSVNEELTTVNYELRMKVDEAGRHNDDLRNLMDASEIATVFVDSAMCVKRFTPQACKLFSLIPTDIGRPLMDVKNRLHYEDIVRDATAAFEQLRPVERSVTAADDEHYLARILPYRTSHDIIGGAVLTFIDVTELRRAQARVQLSEERLREAIASSKDFAVISTNAKGEIATWNEGATKVFGYESNEIVGQLIDVLFTADDRERGIPDNERRIASRDGRASDERWHLRRDGTTFFCSGVLAPLHLGSEVGYLKIARDISEMKERERQQDAELRDERSATSVLKSAAELKDKFLALVSHELKQPLNLIQVNAELLVRLPETKESALVQRVGTTIMQAVAAQETIVNDLLDLSRVQMGKLRIRSQATDLAETVQRLTHALAADATRKGIALHVHAPQPVICDCDPVRIEQVVWNLLGNAIKFTPAGGKISVEVIVDDEEAKLEVADTGVGIAQEFLPDVFELFSQGAAADTPGARRQGLGIGLSLVRQLVQAHGGRIEVASPGENQGATFTIWLALTSAESQSLPAARRLGAFERRILVVDDNEDSLFVFAELLRLEGAIVDSASSGVAALRMVAEGDYDLLLSDVGMPEMSGIELMQRVRKMPLAKQPRGIAITGFTGETDVQRVLDAGFDAHVAKPVSIERLKSVLESL